MAGMDVGGPSVRKDTCFSTGCSEFCREALKTIDGAFPGESLPDLWHTPGLWRECITSALGLEGRVLIGVPLCLV